MIGLFLALLFSLISSGYFLEENRGKSLTRLLINALSAEKSESTDLISSMVRPKGAKKIIDILHKLAAIDDDVAGYENTKSVTSSWIWFVEKDTDRSDVINKENSID